jgi:hypothetical protein
MVSCRTNTIVGRQPRRASAACPTARRVGRLAHPLTFGDDLRVGDLIRAGLINPTTQNPPSQKHVGLHSHVESPHQEWTRDRADVDRPRRLYAPFSECREGTNTVGAVTR